MTDEQVLDWVRAAALAVDLPLDAERLTAVAQTLARTAAMAQQLDAFPLAPHDEPAEIFRAAPFPREDEGS
jgi:hypothetical protein